MLVNSREPRSGSAFKRHLVGGGAALTAAAMITAGLAMPAQADDRVLVPVDKVSVQLYSLIPWVTADGQEAVLNRLGEMGFQNVEPYGGNYNGLSAEDVRAQLDAAGMNAPSSHYNVGEADFDDTLAYVETVGQEYVGSGGFPAPGLDTYENTLATAATMNRLGERSVEAGIGKFFGHNHSSEFTAVYEHNGEEMSAWEILVEETNPEHVTFEVDVAWAAHAGVDVPELLATYGDRVEMLHIKDATELGQQDGPNFTNLGEGDVPLQDILRVAADIDIAYYVMEFDQAPDGEDFVTTGFEYLTGIQPGGDEEPADPIHIPVDQVSIQMFSLIPWVGAEGLEPVLERLSEIGFENIEPFGGTFGDHSAEDFRALTDSFNISVPSSHYNVDEAGFDETLEFVKTVGQEYVGSGGFADPGIGSYEDTLETAATMNRLGEASVEAGIGKFFGHNHAGEFTTKYEHEGELLSAWEILVLETNPEFVVFQLDVAWASHALEDVPAIIEKYGDRIELLHIKDATGLGEGDRPNFTNVGDGDVEMQSILAAAEEHANIAYYVLEYDVAPEGEDFAMTGFEYLTGLEAGTGDDGTDEDGAGEDGNEEDGEGQEGTDEDGAGEEGSAEDGAEEDGAAQDGADEGAAVDGDDQDGDDQDGTGSGDATGGGSSIDSLPQTGGDLSLLLPVLLLIGGGVVMLRLRHLKKLQN